MFFGLLHEAWISIGASRLRTFLAMLGIVIGVGSVVLMLAIGSGSRRAVEESITKLGSNLLIVTTGPIPDKGLRSKFITGFTEQDVAAITQLPYVSRAAPATVARDFQAQVGKLSWNTRVTGTTNDFFPIRNWAVQGELFSDDEMRLGKRVAIIGSTIVKNLFPEGNALGSTIRLSGTPFRVIGVLESKGQDFSGRDQDDGIYVPFRAALNKLAGNTLPGVNPVQIVYVEAINKEALDDAAEDIIELLRYRYKISEAMGDSFIVRNLSSIIQVATETTRALSLLLGAIASISLIVGGIGIMNIMLVTVTERTREIGIRKAIGATEQHILLQFLLEAIIISATGSALGLIIGYVGGLGAVRWFSLSVEYNLWSVILALGVAVGVGLLSGIYPAHKAAKLQPIEALRTVGA
jgi:putative ABC transport system permease protein